MRSLLLFGFASLIPMAALAAGAPFTTPPQPNVPLGPPEISAPPEAPPVAAPPIDIVLPDPAHDVLSDLEVPQGPPDPLPSADHSGVPDLIGVVDLPDAAADVVLGLAPPFGGELGGGHASDGAGLSFRVVAVPEPATGLFLMLGLAGFAARRR